MHTFNLHPDWRNHFAFKVAYPNPVPTLKLDPIQAKPINKPYVDDPVINRFKYPK